MKISSTAAALALSSTLSISTSAIASPTTFVHLFEWKWEETDSSIGKYVGYIKNNKPEGDGKLYLKSKERYEGEWKNGLKHGSGMWRGTKGDSYIGEWKYGKADGYGVHTWRNGKK